MRMLVLGTAAAVCLAAVAFGNPMSPGHMQVAQAQQSGTQTGSQGGMQTGSQGGMQTGSQGGRQSGTTQSSNRQSENASPNARGNSGEMRASAKGGTGERTSSGVSAGGRTSTRASVGVRGESDRVTTRRTGRHAAGARVDEDEGTVVTRSRSRRDLCAEPSTTRHGARYYAECDTVGVRHRHGGVAVEESGSVRTGIRGRTSTRATVGTSNRRENITTSSQGGTRSSTTSGQGGAHQSMQGRAGAASTAGNQGSAGKQSVETNGRSAGSQSTSGARGSHQ
jgi:hypothetical protein